MPVLTILAHGASCGVAPSNKTSQIPEKSKTIGWSTGATRRNTAFLRAVDHNTLTGKGYALTLTLRNCPDSATDWHSTRTKFVHRLRRLGLLRLHWVVEWQRRGVPHLHVAAWFDNDTADFAEVLAKHWLESAAEYRPARKSQTVLGIHSFGGWAQYVAKHASRGAVHCQRNIASMPRGWASSGRVWGKVGQWVTIQPKRLEMAPRAFYAYRRVIRSWRIAQARSTSDLARIKSARTMLRCHDKNRSQVRGISEWIPETTNLAIVSWLMRSGHEVLVGPSHKNARINQRLETSPVCENDGA